MIVEGDGMELTNCAKCGAVFARNVIDICPKCYKEEEEAFKIVYTFLQKQKNRSAGLREIVEATEVEEELIIKFLKQNRLRTSQFPQLQYPCESCGELISEKTLCQKCSSNMLSQWGEAKEQVEQETENKEYGPSYHTLEAKRKDE